VLYSGRRYIPGRNREVEGLSDSWVASRVVDDKFLLGHSIQQFSLEKLRALETIVEDSEAAAQDLLQDVFLKIWKALPGFRGEASCSSWIYTIARNASLTELRKKRPSVSLDDPEVGTAVGRSDQRGQVVSLCRVQRGQVVLHREVRDTSCRGSGGGRSHVSHGRNWACLGDKPRGRCSRGSMARKRPLCAAIGRRPH
jgi:RNA polymerase sigma factor (sigma-70 family)